MTYDEIKNYQKRNEVIQSINNEIEWLYGKVSSPNGHREGGCAKPGPGNPTAHNFARIESLKQKKEILEARQRSCESYVDELEDYRLACILRYKFLMGWTWESTALILTKTRSYNSLIETVKKHFATRAE